MKFICNFSSLQQFKQKIFDYRGNVNKRRFRCADIVTETENFEN